VDITEGRCQETITARINPSGRDFEERVHEAARHQHQPALLAHLHVPAQPDQQHCCTGTALYRGTERAWEPIRRDSGEWLNLQTEYDLRCRRTDGASARQDRPQTEAACGGRVATVIAAD